MIRSWINDLVYILHPGYHAQCRFYLAYAFVSRFPGPDKRYRGTYISTMFDVGTDKPRLLLRSLTIANSLRSNKREFDFS